MKTDLFNSTLLLSLSDIHSHLFDCIGLSGSVPYVVRTLEPESLEKYPLQEVDNGEVRLGGDCYHPPT